MWRLLKRTVGKKDRAMEVMVVMVVEGWLNRLKTMKMVGSLEEELKNTKKRMREKR